MRFTHTIVLLYAISTEERHHSMLKLLHSLNERIAHKIPNFDMQVNVS